MMRWVDRLRLFMRSLIRRPRLEQELDAELQFHLEQQIQENLAGMSAEEAPYAARRTIGDLAQMKEECRDMRHMNLIQNLLQDLLYAARMLRNSAGFTTVAVTSLALGIGANTAVFSLVNDLLLKQVHVTDPDTLVSLYRIQPGGGTRNDFSIPEFEQLRDHNHVFSGTVALSWSNMGLSVDSGPAEFMPGGFYSGNYFSVLGVRPMLGRILTPADDQPGKRLVAMITYSCWRTRFAGDPSVVGKTIYAKGIPVTIVGVTPENYTGIHFTPPDFAFPLTWLPQFVLNDNAPDVQIIARLKPGIGLQQARAELNVVFSRVLRNGFDPHLPQDRQRELLSQSLDVRAAGRGDHDLWEEYRLRITILIAVVLTVLLICCANVGNLLLTRAAGRQKEMAIRLSIGAGRIRLIRQLFTESFLLGALGGTAGVLAAIWVREALAKLFNFQETMTLDWHVLGFTGIVSLLTSILFGVAPALWSTRVDVAASLKERAAEIMIAGGRPRLALGKGLVSLQVALSLLLMIGAGLLVCTLHNLHRVDPGFDPNNVLLFSIFPTTIGYEGDKEIRLYKDLLRKFNQIPGVVQASMARHELMQGGYHRALASSAEETARHSNETPVAVNVVAPMFFSTMRIPLLAGRDFSLNDVAAKFAIVDRKFAANHFGLENPLGKRILLDGQKIEIVGVVRESRYYSLRQGSDIPTEQVFLPFTQVSRDMLGQMVFALRTAGKPMSFVKVVQREMQAVDKNLPLVQPRTQTAEVQDSAHGERSMAALLSFFGGLATLLACIGLYGVMSYTVARRTGEMGIRMALGAKRSNVLGLVLREGLSLVTIGIALGIPAALAMTRYLESLLYEIEAFDPITYLVGATLLACVAAVACWLPAYRAVRVDPMTALRYE